MRRAGLRVEVGLRRSRLRTTEQNATIAIAARHDAFVENLTIEALVTKAIEEITKRWPDCDPAKLRQLTEVPAQATEEFLLSRACLAGSAIALATFESKVIVPVVAQLHRSAKDKTVLDEAIQQARIRLLVDGKLAGYRGRGALAGFVKVTISRLMIDFQRAQQREAWASIEPWEPLLATKSDPELATLRKTFGGALADALGVAWSKLTPDDRLILGMQLKEDLGVQHIAKLYGIHRTSAARRLVAARSRLLKHCRTTLHESLGATELTIDSIIRTFAASSAWGYLDNDGSSLFKLDR